MGKFNGKIPGHSKEFRGMARVCRKCVENEIEKSISRRNSAHSFPQGIKRIKYLTSIPPIGILLHTSVHADVMRGRRDKVVAFKKPTIQR